MGPSRDGVGRAEAGWLWVPVGLGWPCGQASACVHLTLRIWFTRDSGSGQRGQGGSATLGPFPPLLMCVCVWGGVVHVWVVVCCVYMV